MGKIRKFWPLIALFCLLAAAPAARAGQEVSFKDYRLVDATSMWIKHEGLWVRLKLAWVDSTDLNANRPLSHRLELPMSYLELRTEWVRYVRQVETFREASMEAARKILEKSEDRAWIGRPEAGPRRAANLKRATFWADIQVDGKDMGEQLIEQGWSIPLVPPGVEEPANWRELQEKLQKAMDTCKGMWQMVLQQCFIDSRKDKSGE